MNSSRRMGMRNTLVHLNQALITPGFAIQSKNNGYAVEHVLAYSGALPQVPYNQQLGPAAERCGPEGRFQGYGSLGNGGSERQPERDAE